MSEICVYELNWFLRNKIEANVYQLNMRHWRRKFSQILIDNGRLDKVYVEPLTTQVQPTVGTQDIDWISEIPAV